MEFETPEQEVIYYMTRAAHQLPSDKKWEFVSELRMQAKGSTQPDAKQMLTEITREIFQETPEDRAQRRYLALVSTAFIGYLVVVGALGAGVTELAKGLPKVPVIEQSPEGALSYAVAIGATFVAFKFGRPALRSVLDRFNALPPRSIQS